MTHGSCFIVCPLFLSVHLQGLGGTGNLKTACFFSICSLKIRWLLESLSGLNDIFWHLHAIKKSNEP